jgi:hypothetical protein
MVEVPVSSIWWVLWLWPFAAVVVALAACLYIRWRGRVHARERYAEGFRAGVGRDRLLESIATEKTGTGRAP